MLLFNRRQPLSGRSLKSMLILSWNVAGLSTTVNRIHDNYKPCAEKHPAAALANFFQLHQADIVCLQEHKISKQLLTSRAEPRHAASIQNYESFWACCVDESKKGLNGVVTYAKTGTVVAANAAPLQSPDLDKQGRCVMTDHGTFVLFNVYVPCSGGQPLTYKMKFLKALRRSMQERRASGKPVILVGDLNIAANRHDIYWKDRVVHVNDVLEEVASAAENNSLPAWKSDVARYWREIEATLQTKEAVSTVTSNSLTRETYNKFRLAVTVDGNRRVFLGNHEASADYCHHNYDFSGYTYFDEDTGVNVPAREENAVSVAVLAELMAKIIGVQWSEAVTRQIAETAGAVERLSPPRLWLRAVMEEDGMVDAFRHYFPEAQARFTCWNQNKNRRYVNDGARIDYTLIDKLLLPYIQKGEVSTLRCCGDMEAGEDLSEKAALQAATANGCFQPVSFEGGGMVEASQQALDTQFGPPHTGHVYTPPTLSDHIGVSLLLDDGILPNSAYALSTSDSATRKAQPHKQQATIASFFQTGSKGTAKSSAAIKSRTQAFLHNGNAKRAKIVKPPANSVLHHFRKET